VPGAGAKLIGSQLPPWGPQEGVSFLKEVWASPIRLGKPKGWPCLRSHGLVKERQKREMANDTISDMLTRIRNASSIRSKEVSIPLTRLSQRICKILEEEGFIESFQRASSKELSIRLKYHGPESRPCITNLRRISKPGLRIYANHSELPKILGGMGVVIVSTSKGVLTDKQARLSGVGGEILCSIW
jgi:small subunit ribosomal protein S8